MSLSYIEKRYHRGFFFLLRQKCFWGQSLPPRVVFTHERSEGSNWDPRGERQPKDTLLSEEKKKIQGDIDFAMEDVTFFHFRGNSYAEWVFQGQKRPKRPKKAKTLFLVLFPFPGKEKNFPFPGRENFFSSLCWKFFLAFFGLWPFLGVLTHFWFKKGVVNFFQVA